MNDIISIGLITSFISIMMTMLCWVKNGMTEAVIRAIYASGGLLLIVLLTITISSIISYSKRSDY